MIARALSIVIAGALALLAALPTGSALAKERVVDHVVDGDTIEVVIGNREEYVRFIGIDTPEVYEGGVECGGPEASESMDRMLQPGDRVRLVRDRSQDNRDTYGRLLRYVEFNGRDLGRTQVRRGWASVYVFDRPFRRLHVYERSEGQASAAGSGVWGQCGGF